MYCQQKSHSCGVPGHAESSFLLAAQSSCTTDTSSQCLSVALFYKEKALLEMLGFLSKTKTPPVLLILVALKTTQQ